MKKPTKIEKPAKPRMLATTELAHVSGGGLGPPDNQCAPTFKLVCIQSIDPIDTQDT